MKNRWFQALRVGAVLYGLPAGLSGIGGSPANAQSTIDGLPGGATSLKESYGAWMVSCGVPTVNGKPIKICATSQEQTDQRSRQRVLAIELQPTATGASGTLLLPFGLALEQGIALQIDDGLAAVPTRVRACLPAGCIAPIVLDAKMVASLRKATTLKLKGFADGGKEITFDISLKGFSSAFDRTAALLK